MNRFTYMDIVKDIITGLKHWRIWMTLSWYMIKMQFRRTEFGPVWIVLQVATFVIALGYIFANIQGESFSSFFVYITSGYTFWLLISNMVTSGGETFTGLNGLPNLTKVAISNHAFLRISSQLLLFLHQAIPLVVVLLIFHKSIEINLLSFLFGFSMIILFGFWVSIFLGCLCLRFPDLSQAVTAVMQVMFFITPIMFRTSRVPGGNILFGLNPLYHLLILVQGQYSG